MVHILSHPQCPSINLLKEQIRTDASQCVQCGLCVQACPTYQLTQDESESPRGRIALLEGLVTDRLALTDALKSHLDRCLTCRTCERVCPSEVSYGRLVHRGRSYMHALKSKPLSKVYRMLRMHVKHPWLMRGMARLAWCAQKVGIVALLRYFPFSQSHVFGRAIRYLPLFMFPKKIPFCFPAMVAKGRVGLFTGCVTHVVQRDVLMASARCMQQLGYEVVIPNKQACCGAFSAHMGDAKCVQDLAARNAAVFNQSDVTAIVGIATGCTATLMDYSDIAQEHILEVPIQDVCTFVEQHWDETPFTLQSVKKRVAVHTPCTMRNVLQQSDVVMRLLSRIPDIQLESLILPQNCCGGAGAYMLEQPDLSDGLGKALVKAIEHHPPDVIVTTNIGCALQWKAVLREANIKTQVLHPMQMLEAAFPIVL